MARLKKESNLLQLLKVADPETYEKMKGILKKNEEEKKEKDNFLEEDDETD